MVHPGSLPVTSVCLVDRLPIVSSAKHPGRGRPPFYLDRLFSRELVLMIVRNLHLVHEPVAVLQQPTSERAALRDLLTVDDRFPARRTFERRLKAQPIMP